MWLKIGILQQPFSESRPYVISAKTYEMLNEIYGEVRLWRYVNRSLLCISTGEKSELSSDV
jgi:hypothetical protein